MGIRKYRGQIVCDKRWPDGNRTTRVCVNRTQAKQLLARIDASIADGGWREFKEKLKLRDRGTLTLEEYSKTYIEEYAKARNKKNSWKRKQTSFRALNSVLGRISSLPSSSRIRISLFHTWYTSPVTTSPMRSLYLL